MIPGRQSLVPNARAGYSVADPRARRRGWSCQPRDDSRWAKGLVHGYRSPQGRPAVEELGDRERQVDTAVAHALAEVVVPVGAVQRLRVEIDVHHIWHVGDPVGDAAGRLLPPVSDHPDDIAFRIRGPTHVLDRHLVADPEATGLGVVRGQPGADERLQNERLA